MPEVTAKEIIQAIGLILSTIQFWIGQAGVRSRDRREVSQAYLAYLREALTSLHFATNATRNYLEKLSMLELGDQGEEHMQMNHEERMKISQAWVAVGDCLVRISDGRNGDGCEAVRDLANRCFEKGAYWAAPHDWNSKADIKLSKILNETKVALAELRSGLNR